MDYKTCHFQSPIWTREQFNKSRRPEPYDRLNKGALQETDSPDNSAVFLVAIAGLDETHGEFTMYGIEAPRGCPMREAFEWGEISWIDFWSHRNWLLEITVPLQSGDAVSKYISVEDINPETRARFEVLGQRGPYHLKLRQLELSCEYSSWDGTDPVQAERDYRDFMIRHGHRFARVQSVA